MVFFRATTTTATENGFVQKACRMPHSITSVKDPKTVYPNPKSADRVDCDFALTEARGSSPLLKQYWQETTIPATRNATFWCIISLAPICESTDWYLPATSTIGSSSSESGHISCASTRIEYFKVLLSV